MTQESIVLNTTPPFPGADAVAAINKANQALATDFAGTIDPAALAGPYMTWADTGNMLLKRRNAAGTAWVTIGPLLKATLPQYALADIPTTDQGDIWVIGRGGYKWNGTAYTQARDYLPGEVIQQVQFADVGSETTSETFASRQTSSFAFTPKSTNSKIHIQYTFLGEMNAVSGVFTYAELQIVQTAPTVVNLSPALQLQAYSGTAAPGGGISVPVGMTANEIANSALDSYVFSLWGRAQGSSGTAKVRATHIRCVVTEVQA